MDTETIREEAPEEKTLPEVTQEPTETETLPQQEPVPEAEEEEEVSAPRFVIRAEWVLGFLAAMAAVLLLVMVILCLPYFGQEEEDPQALLQQNHAADTPITLPTRPPKPTEETVPTEETEPVIPTIPPAPNPYGRFDFQYNQANYLLCEEQDSYPGVDVSAYQGNIDWQAVKASGIRFAMIRLGYRGYGKAGKLVTDEYALKNLKGAKEAGLAVGAYFFSQALNIKEVDEEIDYMLSILGDFELDMPIVLDWEIPTAEARTANMDARTLTDMQLHFCEVMTEKGYTPMIYFNWYQSSRLMYLSELEDYPFWLALYQDRMTYPYHVEMWQWTCTGKVPGINGDVDINVYMP